MADVSVTWLGHSAFKIDTPDGKRIYLDPWLSNPSAPEGAADVERMDVLAVTHGHDDHVGVGPREAAVAIELLGVHRVLPCHWGTFDALTGTPDELRSLAPGCEILAVQPGDTVEL